MWAQGDANVMDSEPERHGDSGAPALAGLAASQEADGESELPADAEVEGEAVEPSLGDDVDAGGEDGGGGASGGQACVCVCVGEGGEVRVFKNRYSTVLLR